MTGPLLECESCGEVWPATSGRRCRECDRHGVPYQPDEREEPLQFKPKVEPYKEDSDFVSQEFDISGDQREKILKEHFFQKLQEKENRIEEIKLSQKESFNKDAAVSEIKELNKATDDVVHLMNRVLLNKKQLEDAISDLNGQLNSVGFELRPIQK